MKLQMLFHESLKNTKSIRDVILCGLSPLTPFVATAGNEESIVVVSWSYYSNLSLAGPAVIFVVDDVAFLLSQESSRHICHNFSLQ